MLIPKNSSTNICVIWKKFVPLQYKHKGYKVMKAIVFKKSSLERVNTLLSSEPLLVSAVSRVEKLSDSVYFYFDSVRDLCHAST